MRFFFLHRFNLLKASSIVFCFVFLSCWLCAWEPKHCPVYKRTSLPLVEEDDKPIAKMIDLTMYSGFTEKTLYAADLNEDGKKDFIVCAWWGGCGLAAFGCDVFFFLSSPRGYWKTRFKVYCFEKEDILRVNNKNYFLLTTFQSWSTENGHNYWLNRIYSFGKDGRMYEADAEIGSPFPSYIQYLERETHEQAKLSEDSKKRMWEEAKSRIFEKDEKMD